MPCQHNQSTTRRVSLHQSQQDNEQCLPSLRNMFPVLVHGDSGNINAGQLHEVNKCIHVNRDILLTFLASDGNVWALHAVNKGYLSLTGMHMGCKGRVANEIDPAFCRTCFPWYTQGSFRRCTTVVHCWPSGADNTHIMLVGKHGKVWRVQVHWQQQLLRPEPEGNIEQSMSLIELFQSSNVSRIAVKHYHLDAAGPDSRHSLSVHWINAVCCMFVYFSAASFCVASQASDDYGILIVVPEHNCSTQNITASRLLQHDWTMVECKPKRMRTCYNMPYPKTKVLPYPSPSIKFCDGCLGAVDRFMP